MLRGTLPVLRAVAATGARNSWSARARCSSGSLRVSPLWSSARLYATATLCLHAPKQQHTTPAQEKKNMVSQEEEETAFDFEFDPMAGVRHDAAVETAKKSIDSIIEELAPPNAPPEALTKIRAYLTQHPVDALILHAEVQITHIENPDTGVEDRVHLSLMDIKDALEQAQMRKMNLVQMGSRGNELAYCRIRRERPWILKLVQAEMEQAEGLMGNPAALTSPATENSGAAAATVAATEGEAPHHPSQYIGKTKPLIDHQFRDAVDVHFIGWRSKKIVQDIRKGHAVKVTIKDFQSPEAAILKLREMSNAMKTYAEAEQVSHHFTSIVANDREASISFSPPTANKSGTIAKGVKHPSEKEWANALKRMEEACQKVGRIGTYMKSGKLKARNMGASMYRVDKYGRRVD